MVALTFPDVIPAAIVLEPDRITKRGFPDQPQASAPPGPLVALGIPQSIRLNAAAVESDPEVKRFVEAKAAEFRFDLIHFVCNFNPTVTHRVAEAWFQVFLNRTPEGSPQAIAWSMDPLQRTRTVEFKRMAKIGGELKLINVEIGDEITTTTEEFFIKAHDLGGPKPYWQFRELDRLRLEGAYRLNMIVQSPRAIQTCGSIVVRANVRQKKFGLIPYKAALSETPFEYFNVTQDGRVSGGG